RLTQPASKTASGRRARRSTTTINSYDKHTHGEVCRAAVSGVRGVFSHRSVCARFADRTAAEPARGGDDFAYEIEFPDHLRPMSGVGFSGTGAGEPGWIEAKALVRRGGRGDRGVRPGVVPDRRLPCLHLFNRAVRNVLAPGDRLLLIQRRSIGDLRAFRTSY